MRHRVDTFKIGRSSAHRTSMMANMVSSLFMHGEITTTLVKGKAARRLADKMITMGKKGDLHRHRLAVSRLRDKDAVKKLFDEIAPRYQDRDGGYTRIYKLSARLGDNAKMCILKLVDEPVQKKAKKAGGKAEKAGKQEPAKKSKRAEEAVTEENAEAVADAAAQVIADPKVETAEEHSETAAAVVEDIPAESGDQAAKKSE